MCEKCIKALDSNITTAQDILWALDVNSGGYKEHLEPLITKQLNDFKKARIIMEVTVEEVSIVEAINKLRETSPKTYDQNFLDTMLGNV